MKKEKLFVSENSIQKFIFAILKEIINKQGNKTNIITEYRLNNKIFDIYVEGGFNEFYEDVVFEIRNSSKNIDSILLNFEKNLKELSKKNKYIKGILVIPDEIDRFKFLEDIKNIEIWDKYKIRELISEFPILYSNALEKDRLYNNINLENINYDDFKNHNNNIVSRIDFRENLHEYALVLGAGVSIDSGAKSWNNLLQSFKNDLLSKDIIGSNKSKLLEKIGDTNLINAQLFKELMEDKQYYKKIFDGLYEDKKIFTKNSLVFSVLKLIEKNQYKRNFKVITYNYDNYLEMYLDRYSDIKYNIIFDNEKILDDSVPIYHVHGYLPFKEKEREALNNKRYKDSIKLTEDDYNYLYNNSYCWQITIQLSLFRENRCLFVGCSLTDPNIRRLLRIVKHENIKNQPKKHFAILSKEGLNTKELMIITNHFYNMGVEIIWSDDFEDQKSIISKIVGQ